MLIAVLIFEVFRQTPVHSGTDAILSHTMYLLISLKESTLPQNRPLNISISHSKQYIDDVVGELIF